MFGLDWLLDPRFTRLLDNIAASPGAVRGVRAFGALSGGRDRTFPTTSAGVWDQADQPPDFTRTLQALDTLVRRGLTPFLPLTFFPPAVAPRVIEPPADFGNWQRLVEAFLHAVVDRFGHAEVARWWFEVWNEPNMAPFWGGSFDGYLDLYRATAKAVAATSLSVRLGGPVIAYTPEEGPALIERFLQFLRDEPSVKCDFISYHRKGAWSDAEGEPDLARLIAAAESTADAVLRLTPDRADGLAIVNDEADMKVGFDQPFAPRCTSQFPAWLAASMVAHDRLRRSYSAHRMRFLAASDNANAQLARGPFDGRRMLMTPLSSAPADQVKLPVLGFYEMLRCLGDRRGMDGTPPDGVSHLVTVGADTIAVLLTRYRDAGTVDLECVVRDIPWPRANLIQFGIDRARTNAAAGAPDPKSMRLAQELGVLAPPQHGLRTQHGLRAPINLGPFATALVWITPYQTAPPATPSWLEVTREGNDVVLRWTPDRSRSVYSYEISRRGVGAPDVKISPNPLRAAMWIDTAAPSRPLTYAVRAVSASGVSSRPARSRPV